MPLMGSCNVNTPEQMRAMVGEGAADFYASCRQSLDDPDFPRKIAEGREDEIRKSTRTGASLMTGNIFAKGIAGSAQNPAFGRDRDYRILKTPRPRKVMVVGGGSGGMEYALAAHAAGHEVVLYEQGNELGGAMNWAGGYKTLPQHGADRLPAAISPADDREGRRRGTPGHCSDARACPGGAPDVVVVATGARPALPEVAGLGEALASGFALTIDDVLRGAALPDGPVVVWGAGEGIELALDLARQGRTVRLLDPRPALVPAAYIGSRAGWVLRWAAQAGLASEHGLELASITPGSGHGRQGWRRRGDRLCRAGHRPGPGSERSACRRRLRGTGITVQVIGDARKPRSYGNAIHEAAYLARRI